ncbi:hypothetical protein ASD02_27820 [Ensifer sp. Root1252]|jgi:hypothetical protein|nr:hypothetical protein ASD00_34340 [Ensifer sp. Root31]KQW59852.1 hypothetical protein ASD02_27820 [Ensifer sp. Root1252]KQW78636.1 hypothetical protein ASD03_26555 [Ensifer sp. Root127]KQY67142.1 hypothetical protein ASD52_11050 [Ensifer sp. Root142]KRC74055.1 hypothetical protein ASE32_32525 [Ensifer sp. Root231]KRC96928.1 hypothetical protein ASE47_30505 [Ensifer sp. Root258]
MAMDGEEIITVHPRGGSTHWLSPPAHSQGLSDRQHNLAAGLRVRLAVGGAAFRELWPALASVAGAFD